MRIFNCFSGMNVELISYLQICCIFLRNQKNVAEIKILETIFWNRKKLVVHSSQKTFVLFSQVFASIKNLFILKKSTYSICWWLQIKEFLFYFLISILSQYRHVISQIVNSDDKMKDKKAWNSFHEANFNWTDG